MNAARPATCKLCGTEAGRILSWVWIGCFCVECSRRLGLLEHQSEPLVESEAE